MAKRVRTTAAEWAGRVERWRRTGLTGREFSALEGCCAAQLAWWKWRLKRNGEAEREDARATRDSRSTAPASSRRLRSVGPAIVPVTIAPRRGSSISRRGGDPIGLVRRGLESGYGAMQIVLVSGTEVRVEADVDEQALARVLRALDAVERGC